MAKSKIGGSVGETAVRLALSAGTTADPKITATAVRYLLQVLADAAPGRSVEVRVPPFAAVQCIPGPGHSRGTPPNVVELDAATWLAVATGSLSWYDGIAEGRIQASGLRADLSGLLPLSWPRSGLAVSDHDEGGVPRCGAGPQQPQ